MVIYSENKINAALKIIDETLRTNLKIILPNISTNSISNIIFIRSQLLQFRLTHRTQIYQ